MTGVYCSTNQAILNSVQNGERSALFERCSDSDLLDSIESLARPGREFENMYAEWLVIEREKSPIRVFVRRRSMYFREAEAVLGGQRERVREKERDLDERGFEASKFLQVIVTSIVTIIKLAFVSNHVYDTLDYREQDDRS